MKIYILTESQTFDAQVSPEYTTQINKSRNIKPVATRTEALIWCEHSARNKQKSLAGSALTQIRHGKTLLGYKVSKGTDTYTFTFEEHTLDLTIPCNKTQKALTHPKLSNDLEIAQAYDHVSGCLNCQKWCWETLCVSSNFDLQQKINKLRGCAP